MSRTNARFPIAPGRSQSPRPRIAAWLCRCCAEARADRRHLICATRGRVPSPTSRSSYSRPSPTRPSSPSRTRGCSRRSRRARASLQSRSSTRRRQRGARRHQPLTDRMQPVFDTICQTRSTHLCEAQVWMSFRESMATLSCTSRRYAIVAEARHAICAPPILDPRTGRWCRGRARSESRLRHVSQRRRRDRILSRPRLPARGYSNCRLPCQCSRRTADRRHHRLRQKSGPSPTSRSSCSRTSPTRPSSPSRTRGCSRRSRRERAS